VCRPSPARDLCHQSLHMSFCVMNRRKDWSTSSTHPASQPASSHRLNAPLETSQKSQKLSFSGMSDGVLGFRVYRRLCWSSGAHPSAHRQGERGCQNLSDVSGQRRWLGFPWRTAAALSFWALSVILRRRS
jgi:hypothetical protein